MLDRPATSASKWIDIERAYARENFDKRSFEVTHWLSTHPLLQLPKLLELAERTVQERPEDLYYDMGEVRPGQRWDEIPQARFSAVDAMRQLETSGAWFIFRHTQRDPAYRKLFEDGLREIRELAGDNAEVQTRQEDIIIFVTSPNRVTPYHMDRECNFLLQISGSKMLHVFDREDRDILPEAEVERFWAVDNNAPVYRPQFQNRATSYHMTAGT